MVTTLYYFHDPMCSWCYAFDPSLHMLQKELPDFIRIKKIAGGLAPDTTNPMPVELQQKIQQTWRRIEQTVPNMQFNFDFWYGLAAIVATTTTLGFAIQAVKTFRGGIIQSTWILFVIGALSIAIGDAWYYYLELFEEYSIEHIVNLVWYVGYLFVLYSVIKHKKTL